MATLQSGSHVGPYEILSPIGSGGMGEVYRARDGKLKRDVAIKVLPTEWSRDPERLARAQREAEVLASLNHPHIAQIYGHEQSGGSPCLVLEFVDGETIQERLKRGPIPPEEAIDIARQIAEAFEAAHERGVIHRDLKPANVKINTHGQVKVLDFGLAKSVESMPGEQLSQSPTLLSNATAGGAILGTSAYMSPEQAKGRPADARSDIWSFGVVLFEMLAGKPAFTGETTLEILSSVLKADPDWQALPAATPPGIRRLIRRCLQKDRKARLRDIADARFQLEEGWSESAGSHVGVQPSLDARPGARRTHERLWWIAAMIVVMAASGISIWYSGRTFAVEPETRLSIMTPKAGLTSFAISPNGRKLVFVASNQIFVRSLESEAPQPVAGAYGIQPFWSPDSKSIGFFGDGQLKWIDIAGGPARTLAKAPNPRGGTWSSDGTILFTQANSDPIYRVPAGGGEAVPVTRLEPPRQTGHRFPSFLPDGRHFLFYVLGKPEDKGVYLGSLDSMDARRLFAADGAAVFSPPNHVVFARQGALWVQQLDMASLSPIGDASPIASQVFVNVDAFADVALSASATGTVAYRADGGKRQLVWFDRAGHRTGAVGAPDATQLGAVRFSPDGRTVMVRRMVNGNSDIWLIETDRAVLRPFTFGPPYYYHAIWSPDGSRIAMSADPRGPLDLYEKPSNGPEKEKLLLESPVQKIVYDWSPDGRHILYQSQSPNLDVWALPLDGDKKPLPLLTTPFGEKEARFSPDGRWLAYVSNESGKDEVYVQPFPGPGAKTQISTGGAEYPVWRRDGRELFYVGLPNRLMAVPITLSGAAVKAGASATLFDLPPLSTSHFEYDVSLDGQRFLVNALVEDPSPVTVILNWAGSRK